MWGSSPSAQAASLHLTAGGGGRPQRQRLRAEDRAVRAAVEATVRSLKRGLRGNKLPVRGLTRARMFFYGVALMVNLRRVHRYEREEAEKAAEKAGQPTENSLFADM